MEIIEHKINLIKVAELRSMEEIISNLEDAMQIMGDIYYQGYDAIVLHESSITPIFFELKSKMAGEILQKFSNYRMRLVILGDWTAISSKSLSDFIRESNKGKLIYFSDSINSIKSHWSEK
ncbi:MAG: DUF4180 domain-containing protein [Sphingobacterium sp.]|uniref:DUF4180 domain-containing protein n=1 Tax=Sphingobacterium sp. JB170 TaxID=1434842 RepID=UPI00097EE60E|nr:DUF4180 domain-containing protein [Sphingobacterium sp. JB170]SJN29693.1 hypothetical protein FM107_06095 [Sphingobacterium sp. JB170]